MKFKEEIEKVKLRNKAFWELEMSDRALIAISTPKEKGAATAMFDHVQNKKDPDYLKKYWTDPNTIHKMNLKRMENTYFAGEALPSIFLNFGTSGHCNFFGSKPTYSNGTIWFDPVIDDLDELKFDQAALDSHIKLTQELVKLSNSEYFIGMPDSCGTIDALGHLYGSDNVLIDMLGEPEKVKRAIKTVNEGWKISSQKFYDTLKDLNHGGSVHSWMHLMADGKMGQMQCDMSVMFSKDMYEEFAYDELKTQIDWFDYPIYHFDGVEQERHLDILLSFDKLKAIQWTNVAGQPPASHFMPILKRMQDAGKRLIVCINPDEIKPILENLSAKGLMLLVGNVNDKATADEIIKYAEKNSKE